MSRDVGLETLLFEELGDKPGITEKPMFGGWGWLLNGHLLCGARDDGMLIRLGRNNDDWALTIPGVIPMISRGKNLSGWVRASHNVYGDDKLRAKLLAAAIAFVESLPAKSM